MLLFLALALIVAGAYMDVIFVARYGANRLSEQREEKATRAKNREDNVQRILMKIRAHGEDMSEIEEILENAEDRWTALQNYVSRRAVSERSQNEVVQEAQEVLKGAHQTAELLNLGEERSN